MLAVAIFGHALEFIGTVTVVYLTIKATLFVVRRRGTA